jgi:hypothetical protein
MLRYRRYAFSTSGIMAPPVDKNTDLQNQRS